MDDLIRTCAQAQKALNSNEPKAKFLSSGIWFDWCQNSSLILWVLPTSLTAYVRDAYADYLAFLLNDFLRKSPDVWTWKDFSEHVSCRKVARLIHDFGVRAESFPNDLRVDTDRRLAARHRPSSNLTIEELYEAYQSKHGEVGTLDAFKRAITRIYGSFAEYCVKKGFDVNATKWENVETAVRVAKLLGSEENLRIRARPLHQYLKDRNLLNDVFSPASFRKGTSEGTGTV